MSKSIEQCPVCGQSMRADNVARHLKTHENQSKCCLCDAITLNLPLHMKQVHGEGVVPTLFPQNVKLGEGVVPTLETYFPQNVKLGEGVDSNPRIQDPNEITILPHDPQKLQTLFDEKFDEFQRGKLENRNELVFLLDEMLRRGVIDADQFKNYNDNMSNSLDEPEIIQRALNKMLKKQNKAIRLRLPESSKLQKQVDEYLDNAFVGLDEINSTIKSLEGSKIPKSELIAIKMMLEDIDNVRERVKDVIFSLTEAESNEAIDNVLDRLLKEDQISFKEYEKLKEDENAHDVNNIVDVISGLDLKLRPDIWSRM